MANEGTDSESGSSDSSKITASPVEDALAFAALATEMLRNEAARIANGSREAALLKKAANDVCNDHVVDVGRMFNALDNIKRTSTERPEPYGGTKVRPTERTGAAQAVETVVTLLANAPEVSAAAEIFIREYFRMGEAGKALTAFECRDKYFHCEANCQAEQLGAAGSQTARIFSQVREIFDMQKNQLTPLAILRNEYYSDHLANAVGRTIGRMTSDPQRCYTYCAAFLHKKE